MLSSTYAGPEKWRKPTAPSWAPSHTWYYSTLHADGSTKVKRLEMRHVHEGKSFDGRKLVVEQAQGNQCGEANVEDFLDDGGVEVIF